ncbi:MAG: glycosyltransferase family 4 protein [Actinobacteria bacterium]|nr:glycosyltransferase family 4 protein [Actinomycetota bacterium]
MRAAYVTIFGSSDIHAWSGLGVYILGALRSAGLQTETIGDLRYQCDFVYKAKEVLYPRVFRKTYRMLWDSLLLKRFAAQVDRALASGDADVVFSIWTNPIAYSRTYKPIVFWGDGTLAGLMRLYPDHCNLCAETIRDGHRAERLALGKCHLAIYSSDWAARSAIEDYGADPAKVKVVPFGANIDCSRTVQDIRANLGNKGYDTCRLLFVGVDWYRKGGDIALQVVTLLNRRGLPAELHVVGCHPPGELPEFVKVHGFVSKATGEGQRLLDDVFSQAHFFILPTRADCTPVVFPESCSFGLPILTTNVGGIPTIIRDGRNGFAYPPDADPEQYCDTIERLWSSRQEYERLALSAFQEYSERLNWGVAGRRVAELLQEFCG